MLVQFQLTFKFASLKQLPFKRFNSYSPLRGVKDQCLTHTRFPAWIIGIIAAYIFVEYPNGSIRIPKVFTSDENSATKASNY